MVHASLAHVNGGQLFIRYQRYAKCQGHSSSVVQVDFSMDGAVLQSVCNAYEV